MRVTEKNGSIPEPSFKPNLSQPPEEYRTNPREAKEKDIRKLIKLIEASSSETVICKFITQHPELLSLIISHYSTGHHHTWIIPQKVIKTKITPNDKGLVPDYIIGGQSTSGKEWFILELKGADSSWFVERNGKVYFSDTINKGIHQLIEYLDHCDTYQSKFRDEHKLTDFKKPKAILMAGRRSEFVTNQRKKAIKQTWGALLGNRLEIVTYDRLADSLKSKLKDFGSKKNEIQTWTPFNDK